MSNLFNSVLQRKPKTNAFNMSHDLKLSFKFGQLIPILAEEVLPNERWSGTQSTLLKMAPMLAPVLHQVELYCHSFFVPNRIMWPNWEKWITGQQLKTVGATDPEHPWIAISDSQAGNGSLADYIGLPSSDLAIVKYSGIDPDNHPERQLNAFPFCAYQRICFEYYRDQNLEDPTFTAEGLMLSDGHNSSTVFNDYRDLHEIRKRAWQKDYFTSALPWPQAGEEMMVPFGFDADVPVYAENMGSGGGSGTVITDTLGVPTSTSIDLYTTTSGTIGTSGGTQLSIDPEASTFMARTSDLSLGSGSVNDLRTAFRLQEWLEKNARGGTRYVEHILSHFGSRVKDYRVDRPEYIGGGRANVQISEVLQTAQAAESSAETPLGTMAGHGISAGYSGSLNYRSTEHGWIMTIMSVRPKPAYMTGMHRKFLYRKDRLDYPWPTFAHLGEQEIHVNELTYDATIDPDTLGTFGYTPRYSEFRYNYSRVAGDFNTSLLYWTLARNFNVHAGLDSDFITVDDDVYSTDLDRIFAVQDGTDYLWCQVVHDLRAVRPLPKYATPIT